MGVSCCGITRRVCGESSAGLAFLLWSIWFANSLGNAVFHPSLPGAVMGLRRKAAFALPPLASSLTSVFRLHIAGDKACHCVGSSTCAWPVTQTAAVCGHEMKYTAVSRGSPPMHAWPVSSHRSVLVLRGGARDQAPPARRHARRSLTSAMAKSRSLGAAEAEKR